MTPSTDPDTAQRRNAHQHYAAGDVDQAIWLQRNLVERQAAESRPVLKDGLYLALYLNAANRLQSAARVLEQFEPLGQGHFDYHLDRGILYRRLDRRAEALKELHAARRLDPSSPQVMAALCRIFANDRDHLNARRFGEMALVNLAKQVKGSRKYEFPSRQPPPLRMDHAEENIIAFSMWNWSRNSVRCALHNAMYAQVLYPGWTCRFYTRSGAPAAIVKELGRYGAQVAFVGAARGRFNDPEYWRLHVLTDKNVRYFLLREAHHLLSLREAIAVRVWIASGKWFHVMRDHYDHTSLIMPGMWGGARGVLPSVHELMKGFEDTIVSSGSRVRTFLQYRVWPTVSKSSMVHDSCFRTLGAIPFPKNAEMPGGHYVGDPSAAGRIRSMVQLPDYKIEEDQQDGLISAHDEQLF